MRLGVQCTALKLVRTVPSSFWFNKNSCPKEAPWKTYCWKIGKGVTNLGGIMLEIDKASRSHLQYLPPLWSVKKERKQSLAWGVTDFLSIVTRYIGPVFYSDTRNKPRMYSNTEIQILIEKIVSQYRYTNTKSIYEIILQYIYIVILPNPVSIRNRTAKQAAKTPIRSFQASLSSLSDDINL